MAEQYTITAWGYLRRFILAILFIFFGALFLIWRIDNPRAEAIRFYITDALPDAGVIYRPFTSIASIVTKFQSYEELSSENKELRRQLRQIETWREAALQLEQINAELRSLNNLKYTTKDDYITADIISDSGSPYSKSALINVGKDKGVKVGAPAIDGFGLIGRVIGVGEETSRILLLNDGQSEISATIMPDRIQAIVKGNNTGFLEINLIDSGSKVLAGSRVVTSGDGILPPDLPIGYVEIDNQKHIRVKIAADYNALEFARIIISKPVQELPNEVPIIVPPAKPAVPAPVVENPQ